MTEFEYNRIIGRLRDIIKGSEWENHVYAVGGCVRDVHRGERIKDIDLVVDLPDGGIRFANWLHENDYTYDKPQIASSFGTAQFRLKEFLHDAIDCVQTRSEEYLDRTSRNPVVRYGTLEEDAKRRDFTINALYHNVSTNEIWDSSGFGIFDIDNGTIDCVDNPDIIFSDDALRLLRAMRFHAKFGYRITQRTWNGIMNNAHRLETIVPERIQSEFNQILVSPYAVSSLQNMVESGLMKYVIPELLECKGFEQNKYHCDDVLGHIFHVVLFISSSDLTTRMAALLHDIAKPRMLTIGKDGERHFYEHELESGKMAEAILNRLKYPKNFIKDVRFLVENHMCTKNFGIMGEKVKTHNVRQIQYRCGNNQTFQRLMELIAADNNSHAPGYCMPFQTDALVKIDKELIMLSDTAYRYKPPIDGNEVREILEAEPSPVVGYTMKRLTRWALSKDILPSASECRQYVKQNAKYYKSKFNIV